MDLTHVDFVLNCIEYIWNRKQWFGMQSCFFSMIGLLLSCVYCLQFHLIYKNNLNDIMWKALCGSH